jgi:hypothetical protein
MRQELVGATKFAGKTGTAQVRRISQLERDQDIKNKDLPWKFRDHSYLLVLAQPTNQNTLSLS